MHASDICIWYFSHVFLSTRLGFGINTILFEKYFKYTSIIDIQQIDQDLIVSSWLIYIISCFFFFGLNTILLV